MKQLIFFLVFQTVIKSFAQVCDVQQTIIDDYTKDAELLSLREIYSDTFHIYADSITIPSDLVNNYIDILSVIYSMENDITDTIFNIYQIHIYPDIPCTEISMFADTSYSWIKDFLQDSLVSGNADFDSLMTKYDFKLQSYGYLNSTAYLTIASSSYLNLYPVVDTLEKIPGLESVGAGSFAGDGNDIEVTYTNDTAFVDFSIGWGDCPAGCINRRYWKFKVFNCTGSYIGSSGRIINSNKLSYTENIKIYPNPVIHELNIEIKGLSAGNRMYELIDMFGRIVKKDQLQDSEINSIDVSHITYGTYMLKVFLDNEVFVRRVTFKQ